MTDKEKDYAKCYPEAALLVELAKAAWNGNIYTASVERGNHQIGVITLWKTKARSGA